MVFELDKNELVFPHPSLAEPDGLLAIGGDLGAERLLLAYHNGIFPWYSDNEPVCWYAPHRRCVIFPEKIRVSKSMQKLLDKDLFEIKVNTAFEQVIENCKTVPRKGQQGTWITKDMQIAYTALHELGVAHSIEVWRSGELAGGIYGVELNGVFCGESMFSKISNASKVALIWLCHSRRYRLVDCQVPNDHLLSLGAEMISQQEFLDILQNKSECFSRKGAK
jgi:leucyl/phenylalanyl-tRNA--protein transferase